MTDTEREHVMSALTVAIREQRRIEQEQGHTRDSLALSVWVDLLRRMQQGELR